MSKEHNPEKIQEKIKAGLTLEQAIDVLDRQAAHDAPLPCKGKRSARNAPATSGDDK
jgi:hypothetical protein